MPREWGSPVAATSRVTCSATGGLIVSSGHRAEPGASTRRGRSCRMACRRRWCGSSRKGRCTSRTWQSSRWRPASFPALSTTAWRSISTATMSGCAGPIWHRRADSSPTRSDAVHLATCGPLGRTPVTMANLLNDPRAPQTRHRALRVHVRAGAGASAEEIVGTPSPGRMLRERPAHAEQRP